MKRILSRIFSVALAAVILASPASALTIAKKSAASSKAKTTSVASMKVGRLPAKAKAVNPKTAPMLPKSRKAASNSPFRTAKSSAPGIKSKSNAAPRAIVKAEGNMPQINGSLLYFDGATEEDVTGVYRMPTAAGQQRELIAACSPANYGGVLYEGVYYTPQYVDYGIFQFVYVSGVDIESGESVYEVDGDIVDLAPGGMGVDPKSGKIYGLFFNEDATGYVLKSVEYAEDAPVYNEVGTVTGGAQNYKAFAIDGEGKFYAIGGDGCLYSIDRATAAASKIGSTGYVPYYISGATIDAKSGRMFWTVNPADETGFLTEVNLTTGAATVIYNFPDNDEWAGLYVPQPAADDKAPAECKNVTANFEGASLSGNISLTTPSTLFDGTAGSGELIISVLANGEQVGVLDAGWGKMVNVPVDLSLMGAGSYNFTVFASNETGEGPKTKLKDVWVGADTPEATKATLTYANGNMEIKWNAVTASVNGGYLDLSKLTYTVKDSDGEVLASGLTTTSYTLSVQEPEQLTSYYYIVEVVCDGLISAQAMTNTVVLGSIVPPYSDNFDEGESDLAGWTVLDANEDGKMWSAYNGAVRVSYNTNIDMDDWLITPPVKLEAGKAYKVSYKARGNSDKYSERLEVKYGKNSTAAGLDKTLVASQDISGMEWIEFSEMLVPDASGIYYIGFHGISDADQYYLWLDDFSIEAGISAEAPSAVTDLTVTPDATGALKATVSFKAPTKAFNGSALSSLTKIEVYRGETLVKTFDNPTPGASLSFDDTLAEGGDVTYTVIASNAEGAGEKATATAFIGFQVPEAVPSATIARTSVEGEVIVTWESVTKDINGLVIPADQLSYVVAVYGAAGWEPVAQNLKGNSYSFQAVEAGEQDMVQCAVFAVDDVGSGSGAATDLIPVGKPYDGLAESFADGNLSYAWGISTSGGGEQVSIYGDDQFSDAKSQDLDNGMIGFRFAAVGNFVNLFSGLISLDGIQNPGFTFYTYNLASQDGIAVSVKTEDQDEWTVVKEGTEVELCGETPGWSRIMVPLTAYANKVIQVQITGECVEMSMMLFDNFTVGSLLGNDLGVKGITAPEKVKVGADYKVDVEVENCGTKDAASYKVELYADEELVATKDGSNLASGATANVSFDCNMSQIATEPVTYFAKVVYASDEDAANNQSDDVKVTPVLSPLPAAKDLTGSVVDNGIKLTWSEPDVDGYASEVTEDFEDADAFSNKYGEWTFADVDGEVVGGFENVDVPNITPGETKGSFWIWDQSQVGNDSFKAHSGTKYLFALFQYEDHQTDDWAISPELSGTAQTISFYAKSYSDRYPEKIAVYYSTGSVTPEDFVMVEGSQVDEVPGDWTLYEISLPAGAKHFAIRSFAAGSFMLMVDDVTYAPAGAGEKLQIEGYNVYRDGVKINDALIEDTEFVDTQVASGEEYTYVVTAVFTAKGESGPSNEVVIKNTGVDSVFGEGVSISAADGKIIVLNAEGLQLSVASVNGAVVYSGKGEAKTEITVAGGVYIVKAGKNVRKLVVR